MQQRLKEDKMFIVWIWLLVTEYTLESKNEAASGLITDVTTS